LLVSLTFYVGFVIINLQMNKNMQQGGYV